MAIAIDKQVLTLAGVTSITVSEIVPDEVNGGFVRRIYFYTEPLETANRRPDIELLMTSDTEANLELQTPNLRF